MSLRVANTVERNIISVPAGPVVVVDSKSTTLFTDEILDNNEYAGRYIQNVGANDCYYAFGVVATPTNYNGILSKPGTLNVDGLGSGQQLDCSNFGGMVSVFSRGGTTIAVTLLKRNDNVQGSGGILTANSKQNI